MSQSQGNSFTHGFPATLEDLYSGKTTKFEIQRERNCDKCAGLGGQMTQQATCLTCKGHGDRNAIQQDGPKIFKEGTLKCQDCAGSGINPKVKLCEVCKGKKVVLKNRTLDCNVVRGTHDLQYYKFGGESNQHPFRSPGDITFILKQEKHELFTRMNIDYQLVKGLPKHFSKADLFFKKTISLKQALTGVDFTIDYLDGAKLRIQSEPKFIVKPDMILIIEDKGLPYLQDEANKRSKEYGNIYIQFAIELPKKLNPQQIESMVKVLKKVDGQVVTYPTQDVQDKDTNTLKLVLSESQKAAQQKAQPQKQAQQKQPTPEQVAKALRSGK